MCFTGAYKHIRSSFNCQLPHSQPEAFGAPVRLGPPGSLPTFSILNPALDSWDTEIFTTTETAKKLCQMKTECHSSWSFIFSFLVELTVKC